MDNDVDDLDAISQLDRLDAQHGVNKPIEVKKTEHQNSLGRAKTYDSFSESEESPWKILDSNLLPSKGMMYPENSEIVIKSASTGEIKHWSTMDEHDPIDIKEKINYIFNKCVKFKIKGQPVTFNFNDYSHVDRYHLLFRVYELTFPNQENKLMANIKCKQPTCGNVNTIQVTSRNLIGFNTPEELVQWYSNLEKCFVVNSEKLGETLRFYIPNTGIVDKFKNHRKKQISQGKKIDESFYKLAPYLAYDWRNITDSDIFSMSSSYNGWSRDKFLAVNKFVELLKDNELNKATGVCEKCKSRLEDHIFSGGSFTTKDIFIISGRFDEFI